MQTRTIGRWLLVAIAVLVVGVGGVAAHAGVGQLAGDGTLADAVPWPGVHMGDVAEYHCDGGTYGAMMHGHGGMMGGTGGYGMMGPAGGYGMTGGGLWGLGFLVPLLLIGLAIAAGYVLVTRTGPGGTDPALEVLRRRYASGELSEEEFASRREALES